MEVAPRVLAAGAQRVVLGTAAVWSPATMASLLTEVGPDGVVAALDVATGGPPVRVD